MQKKMKKKKKKSQSEGKKATPRFLNMKKALEDNVFLRHESKPS